MGIIELPAWRLHHASGREVLRSGVVVSQPIVRVVKPQTATAVNAYCDRCAAPIEFGSVSNGYGTFCSIECSLEGPNRTA